MISRSLPALRLRRAPRRRARYAVLIVVALLGLLLGIVATHHSETLQAPISAQPASQHDDSAAASAAEGVSPVAVAAIALIGVCLALLTCGVAGLAAAMRLIRPTVLSRSSSNPIRLPPLWSRDRTPQQPSLVAISVNRT
jgi:hypothetical protein